MTLAQPGAPAEAAERELLEESLDRLFRTAISSTAGPDAEGAWPTGLWAGLADIGAPWLGLPVEQGGTGGDSRHAVLAVAVAARHAAPVPLAESSLLAGWALAAAGLDVPQRVLTAAAGWPPHTLTATRDGDILRVSGSATGVPWARNSASVVTMLAVHGEPAVACLPAAGLRIEEATNLAGEPRDTVTAVDVPVPAGAWASAPGGADTLVVRGAAARCVAIAAVAQRVVELSVAHARDRVQFDRPIAQFQAVQHHLARLAGAAAAAQAAAHLAARALAGVGPSARLDAAAAKVVASEAAAQAAALAHQVHGAIGMTREHELHRFTRRLWSWRDEFGTEHRWAAELGRAVAATPGDAWAALVPAAGRGNSAER
ncbi:MAG TPA: acyl-CoA dehydrogenase family protein [Acidimicrobiia bacterium]|nr:acyl-CoA dehydrogenase family protein [Acidimicrobiia bacterium]